MFLGSRVLCGCPPALFHIKDLFIYMHGTVLRAKDIIIMNYVSSIKKIGRVFPLRFFYFFNFILNLENTGLSHVLYRRFMCTCEDRDKSDIFLILYY